MPAIEPRKGISGADAVSYAEGNTDRRASASAWTTRRGQRPWHVRDASCTGTGRSRVRPFGRSRRSASGRRGAVADDVRGREVRSRHSSWETDEQSGLGHCEVGGAKGGGREERGPAKHAPDTGPGTRVTGAGARAASFAVRNSRWEPRAGMPLARICAGGDQQ